MTWTAEQEQKEKKKEIYKKFFTKILLVLLVVAFALGFLILLTHTYECITKLINNSKGDDNNINKEIMYQKQVIGNMYHNMNSGFANVFSTLQTISRRQNEMFQGLSNHIQTNEDELLFLSRKC